MLDELQWGGKRSYKVGQLANLVLLVHKMNFCVMEMGALELVLQLPEWLLQLVHETAAAAAFLLLVAMVACGHEPHDYGWLPWALNGGGIRMGEVRKLSKLVSLDHEVVGNGTDC